ncbi:GIY-YIG nuclease family protein [Agrobacterium sp. 22094]|uniref:GIY-YIG nuclease family protein n=1 Tax=Agrobacterium sp. 22094 TaxID=3453872 RepID=UPI003F83575A
MTETTPAWDFSKARRNRSYKQKDGVATVVSSRIAKSGGWAHSCMVRGDRFTLFSPEEFCPFSDGDRISFDYEEKRLRRGSRMPYNAMVPDSLCLTVPSDLSDKVKGHVYVLSNKSMPGVLKIGFTNGDPAKRAGELSGVTGVPTPFRVEWSLPILGSARAIEQRIHAVLVKKKHGKEFFKVSIDEAQSVARRCYLELYPEAAAELEGSLTASELAAADRRRLLADANARREQAKRDEEAVIAFENSPEQIWRKFGTYEVRLREFSVERRSGTPNIFSKFLGHRYPDWIDVRIYGRHSTDQAYQTWKLDMHGLCDGKRVGIASTMFDKLEDAMSMAKREADRFCAGNQQWIINLPNHLVIEPLPWPEGRRAEKYATMHFTDWPDVQLKPEFGSLPKSPIALP